jgi:hypothetical protein
MPTRRVIRGVLGTFLGSFTSRYSDYHGYWLFGFLVADLTSWGIDLLNPNVDEEDTPKGRARFLAVRTFAKQVTHAGLDPSRVREAWLAIRRSPEWFEGQVNGHTCRVFYVSFSVEAVMDDGRRYEQERNLVIAPHNPAVEMQS